MKPTVGVDILSSSAWSAVVHHPAEDSEPEDLPSTVDMDAIKVSENSISSQQNEIFNVISYLHKVKQISEIHCN